jgi:hypothetical protein
MAKSRNIFLENFLRMIPQVPEYSDKNQHALIAGADPIYYLDESVQEEQIAPMAASADWQSFSPLIDEYSESNQDNTIILSNGNHANYAMSFTVPKTTTVGSVSLYLKKVGTISGDIGVYIYATTGAAGSKVATGSALCNAVSIQTTSLSTSYQLITTQFLGFNQITLTAGVTYAIGLTYAAGDGSNYVGIGIDSSSPTADGQVSHTDSVGGTWTLDSGKAFCYHIYNGFYIEGNVVDAVPATDSTYSAYLVTDTGMVYGLSTVNNTDVPSALVSLGYYTGSKINYTGSRLCAANGVNGSSQIVPFLYVNGQGKIWGTPVSSISWAQIDSGHTIYYGGGIPFMEAFLDFISVAGTDADNSPYHWISKFDMTANLITDPPAAGIDVGKGWGIIGTRNYNNKYLAIAIGRTSAAGGVFGFPQNYLLLWDGISPLPSASIKIPGKYLGMKVIDGTLYVAVQTSNQRTVLYFLYGTTLRKVKTPQYSNIIDSVWSPVPSNLFDYRGYIGMHLDDTNDFEDPLMIHGSDEMGEFDFIQSYGRNFDQIFGGFFGGLFANEHNGNGSNSVLWYLPPPASATTYQNLLYRSQWIPCDGISALKIYYDTPPQADPDAIAITVYGEGENILAGTSTTVLNSITAENALTQKMHLVDLSGFQGSKIRIEISTANTTWRPIIRGILLVIPD